MRVFTVRFYKFVAALFFLLALFFFFFPSLYTYTISKFFIPTTASQQIRIKKSLVTNKKIGEFPTRIRIPSVGIDLPIVPAKVINGYWELSDTSASYGLGSGVPGEQGNTVIFAHARIGLFLPLRDTKLQDSIYVYTQHHAYVYSIIQIKKVYPTDTDVIGPTKREILTLFTCSGFMDTMRLVVIAKPVRLS